MARFKPQVTYLTRESREKYYNTPSYVKGVSMYITKQFNTYQELKRELPEICNSNIDDDGVSVTRSKRGQWGEWYEIWKLSGDKPVIVKEGWN